jgi:hypothetical protein
MLALALASGSLGGSVYAASDDAAPSGVTAAPPLHIGSLTQAALDGLDQPSATDTLAQRRGGYRGGRRSRGGGRRDGAAGAIVLGAAAAIAGAAVLAYANRPECEGRPRLSGCGYGTKVIGTSVLAGGLVGVMVGAAMWR